MKKKVSFEKRIDFPTMVGEISAISLEHDLKFINESYATGNLILSGKYKITEASRLEEEFNYKIPVEISLTEKLNLDSSSIEISNFTYEIQDENIMICNIELLVDGLEQLDDIEGDTNRECDGESEDKEKEIPIIEKNETIVFSKDKEESQEKKIEEEVETKEKQEEKQIITTSNIFNISDESETYGTLLVYVVRENETINSIITKYNTTVEELEKYNDLKEITTGTKLIIPLVNE